MTVGEPSTERPLGTVATFYSFKGGVGRTQSLMNVAVALSHNGFRVLIVDLDLLAPGVQTFPIFREALHDVVAYQPLESRRHGYGGVLDLVERQFKAGGKTETADGGTDAYARWIHRGYMARGSAGFVDVLPAGPTDHRAIDALAQVGWYRFLVDFGGLRLFERMRDELWRTSYDFILVDSRTGLSDYLQFGVGILPDIAVLVSALNTQNIEGMAAAMEGVEEVLQLRTSDLHIVPVLSLLPAGELDLLDERLQSADRVWRRIEGMGPEKGHSLRFISDPIKLPYVGTLAMLERLIVPFEHDAPIFRPYLRLAEVLARHRFSEIDNTLNEAIYLATSGLGHDDVSDRLSVARRASRAAEYMYGRVRTEKLDGQRLVYSAEADSDKRRQGVECFKTMVELARTRRGLDSRAPWTEADPSVGHWQVELDGMVFYGRALAVDGQHRQAVAAFTDALHFLDHFERRNHGDIFSDRDWESYAHEVLFTRAFCELGRLEAQIEQIKRNEPVSVRTLRINLAATRALFARLSSSAPNPTQKKLDEFEQTVERLASDVAQSNFVR